MEQILQGSGIEGAGGGEAPPTDLGLGVATIAATTAAVAAHAY